ncbi:MAG: nucleotidyltransferase family protein [Gemmatimonadota bacterium]|nr:nucleotidyltransferase family protein [Gemmatimonadota bacterium]
MSAHRQHPFAAIVLAAGAGSRFGAPKVNASLPDGRRFLDVVVERCATAGADPIICVVPPEAAAPAPARAVVNPHAAGEQVKSLQLGLAQLANTDVRGVLVWPVDHPFALELSALAVVDAARRTNAPVVVPVQDGRRGHPVWFARETWRELITVPEGGARAVVHSYGAQVHEVAVPDAGVCRDIDTPADLG